MEPMKMRPYYRYGEMTPWGGDALRRMFGKDAPEDRAGESLEVSALEGMESVILSGEFTGMTLAAALRNHYAEIVGEENGPFPLLLKLLDARDTLSVQVHPGDDYAREHDGKLGKTEAWMVLSADPGAKIAYGLKPTDEKLSGIVARGEFEQALNFVTVAPGDVYYIPHGMVHALGGGVQVYEIQQSSDATYRFWDWGRVGKDGKPRALHIDKALDVTHLGPAAPQQLPVAPVKTADYDDRMLAACDYFTVHELDIHGTVAQNADETSFHSLLCTACDGELTVSCAENTVTLRKGESAFLPAGTGAYTISGTGTVLRTTV